MDFNNFLLFAISSLVLNLTPGVDMVYVATRSTGQGVKAGIVSAIGIMTGCMFHIVAAVIGLSALIANSAVAFSVLKYLGAGYLIFIGAKTILSRGNSFALNKNVKKLSYAKIFLQGVITNLLNPKVALFFLAFLPQFIDPSKGDSFWQILFLGAWFDFSGTVVNIIVAILFGKMGGWLSRSTWFVKYQHKLSGILLILLGIKVAISRRL